jgi:hypothetical protein
MTRLDPVTRKQKRKGNPIKHMLGDIVLVDCNVKGSDIGTPTDPKFALRSLWEAIILPVYDALTAVGGPAEGAVVVHQDFLPLFSGIPPPNHPPYFQQYHLESILVG